MSNQGAYSNAIDYLPNAFQDIPINEDKFLFTFLPSDINKVMIFQLKLETGVIILSIFYLIEFFGALKNIVYLSSLLSFIWNIILSVVFLLLCLYTYYSTKNPKKTYIKFAYLLSAVVISIRLLGYVCKSFYLIICFLYPFNSDFLELDFLIYVFGKGLYLFIYLYFVWIYYCFMIRGKEEINPESELIFNEQNDFVDISNNNDDVLEGRNKND